MSRFQNYGQSTLNLNNLQYQNPYQNFQAHSLNNTPHYQSQQYPNNQSKVLYTEPSINNSKQYYYKPKPLSNSYSSNHLSHISQQMPNLYTNQYNPIDEWRLQQLEQENQLLKSKIKRPKNNNSNVSENLFLLLATKMMQQQQQAQIPRQQPIIINLSKDDINKSQNQNLPIMAQQNLIPIPKTPIIIQMPEQPSFLQQQPLVQSQLYSNPPRRKLQYNESTQQTVRKQRVENEWILLRINNLSNYNRNKNLQLKSAITHKSEIFIDKDGLGTQDQQQLIGISTGVKSLTISHEKFWNVDHKNESKKLSQNEINEYFVYIALYEDDSRQTPVGWIIEPLFRIDTQMNMNVEINSQRILTNLFQPPSYKPPFIGKKQLNPIGIDFTIMAGGLIEEELNFSERYKNIQDEIQSRKQSTPESVHEDNELKVEDESELEDDNKHITVSLIKLSNSQYRGKINFKIELRNPFDRIKDRGYSPCHQFGKLELNREGQNWQTFKNDHVFNLSETFLRTMYKKKDRSDLFFNIELRDELKNLIGLLQLPIFKEDMKSINIGYFIETLDDAIGEDIELELQIQMEQKKGDAKWYDPNKGLLISLEKLSQYNDINDIQVSAFVFKNGEIIKDNYQNDAVWTSKEILKPLIKKKMVDIKEAVEMALNWIQIKKELCMNSRKETEAVGITIVIYKINDKGSKEELAWFMHPFYDKKKFKRGKFLNIQLWAPPSLKTAPIIDLDDLGIQKLDLYLDYQIDQCRLDDDAIGAVIDDDVEEGVDANPEENPNFLLELNYVDDEKDDLKTSKLSFAMSILEDGEILRDDNGKAIKETFDDQISKVGDRYRFYEEKEINLCLSDLKIQSVIPANKYKIVFVFRNNEKKICAWGFGNVLNQDNKNPALDKALILGSVSKPLFYPPVNIQKLDDNSNKACSAFFNYTIKYSGQNPVE